MIDANQISIIITTHNRAPLLGRAIDSVLNQISHDFEHVIVDDNSSDDTYKNNYKLLKKYPNVIYIKNETNMGAATSRIVGVKAAYGNLVPFLDNDDQFTNDRLYYLLTNFGPKWSFIGTGLLLYG